MKIRPNFELFKQQIGNSVVFILTLLRLITVGSHGRELREMETMSTHALTTIVVAACFRRHYSVYLVFLFG